MTSSATSIHDFKAKNIKGEEVSLGQFKGKAILVVNTASKCGFTPQYKGLQELHDKFAPLGFEVLGFPCNQFGSQEPGTEKDIAQFCELTFHTTFPMFSKVDVNGDTAHPVFKFLKKSAPGLLGTESIKWNFTKFLIDKNGHPVKRFAPTDTPESIAPEIEKILKA